MFVFIFVTVLVFLLVIVLFNFDKIKAWIKNKFTKKSKKEEKPKEEKPKESDSKISYEEFKPEVKVDNLHNDVEYEETPFVSSLTEEEEKVLENPSKGKAGRIKGDVKSVSDLHVEVEDLGEYDADQGFMDAQEPEELDDIEEKEDSFDFDSDLFDDFEFSDDDASNKSISDEIRNLSPEVKALLIDNVLKRKD